MSNLLLGIHVSKESKFLKKQKKAKDISQAIEADMEYLGLNACQIFVSVPQTGVLAKINYNNVKEICHDIDLTVHSSYTTTGVWSVKKDNAKEPKSKQRLKLFENQMEACAKIGAWGFVLHIAKQYPEDIAETMKILKHTAKKTGVKIILEMVASKADDIKTYETPEKLNNLITLIGPDEPWWGLCIDTAHVWAAGCDEVQHYDSMKSWLDRVVFKKKICMFHLNGIYTECGSGKDKHAIAFSSSDKIWGKVNPEKSGVKAIVEYSLEYGLPLICEINVSDEDAAINSLETIKKLADKLTV